MSNMLRIGYSKDIHRLVKDRPLILGGVNIPFELGEMAHSDGDVIYHALGEAILGALALGDLGKHFPDNAEWTHNMNSKVILETVKKLMSERDYSINNIDIQLQLEKPKVKDYIPQMIKNIAAIFEIEENQVSIKAGTNEGCGEVGRSEAVEATAVVTIIK